MDSENTPHHQAALDDIVVESNSEQTEDDSTEPNEASALSELVDSYLVAKRTTGSPAYAKTAESVLHRWVTWMETNEYDLIILDTPQRGPQVLNEYALDLAKRVQKDELSPATADRYFAYISAALSYGVRQSYLDRNPALTTAATENLPTQNRTDRTDQQFWSADQRKAIVKFVDNRVTSSSFDGTTATLIAARDRALVRVLAYSGVRGAEILSHPADDRDGRHGLRWKNVDIDAGTMLIFGKDQSWERTPLPTKCQNAMTALKQTLQPASEDWPVFCSGHRPSLYGAAREALGDRYKETLSAADGTIRDLLREEKICPPGLTTSGARKLLQRHTDQADIDVEDGYLKLHGGRRGLGDLLYRRDRGHAQDILRHEDLATTQQAYQHIDAEERSKELDSHLADLL